MLGQGTPFDDHETALVGNFQWSKFSGLGNSGENVPVTCTSSTSALALMLLPVRGGPVSAAAGSCGAIVGLVDNLERCPTTAGQGGDAILRLLLKKMKR